VAFSVLFVCVGNVCRSPLAEGLLKARLDEIQVTSAGVRALAGNAVDGSAEGELR